MNAKVFVDTNVLVYFRDASEADKQQQAKKWLTYLWETGCGCLSYQVLQEFYYTVTQKLKPGMTCSSAQNDVRALLAWRPVAVDYRVMESAWYLQERYSLGWWDALIVAAAQISGSRYLLTEDLQAEQSFGSVQIINPLQRSWESIA